MSIVCVGLSHATTAVDTLEKFSIKAKDVPRFLAEVRSLEGLVGAVALSTCNRVEVYAEGSSRIATGLVEVLRRHSGLPVPLEIRVMPESISHLFRVGAGLDSMVLGETEILGQMKQAYLLARELGVVSPVLDRLFQQALRAARRVRSETRITRGATSLSAAAVEFAERILGDLGGRRVMILGAGETGERAARSLFSRGVRALLVSNRHFDRANELATALGGQAISFDDWPQAFPDVDIILCSTAAPRFLLTVQKIAPLLPLRNGRPLCIMDLAVPRNVDPDVGALGGVSLYDMDSLGGAVRETMAARRGELTQCEEIIAQHAGLFVEWHQNRYGEMP